MIPQLWSTLVISFIWQTTQVTLAGQIPSLFYYELRTALEQCSLNPVQVIVCMFGWCPNVLIINQAISRAGPKTDVWQFYVLPHTRQSGETMTSVSAGHIILTPIQPVGSGRPQRQSNPGPPHQESRALPTELPRPLNWTGQIPVLFDLDQCSVNLEQVGSS